MLSILLLTTSQSFSLLLSSQQTQIQPQSPSKQQPFDTLPNLPPISGNCQLHLPLIPGRHLPLHHLLQLQGGCKVSWLLRPCSIVLQSTSPTKSALRPGNITPSSSTVWHESHRWPQLTPASTNKYHSPYITLLWQIKQELAKAFTSCSLVNSCHPL